MLIIFSVVFSGSRDGKDIKYICFKIDVYVFWFSWSEKKNNGNQYSISNKCSCDIIINEPSEMGNIWPFFTYKKGNLYINLISYSGLYESRK